MTASASPTLGRRMPRYDGLSHVTGKAVYTADRSVPGMLWATARGSDHHHARILNVDTAPAERMPGVLAVITAKDIPNNRCGYADDWEVLAGDVVLFKGQPIAAVAAVDEDTARRAAAAIRVEYEVLPAVLDPEAAMAPGAPLARDGGNLAPVGDRDHFHIGLGDVEAGLRQANYVFHDVFRTQTMEHAPLETHAVLVVPEPSGTLTVYLTSHRIFTHQQELAKVLQMPLNKVRVIGGTVGGSFGGKAELTVEPGAAVLALKTGRPVKWVWSRAEEFRLSTTRSPYVIEITTGVMRDGTVVARKVRSIKDIGAYNMDGNTGLVKHGIFCRGPYRVPNYTFDGYAVFTNRTPAGALRGWGVPQASFAVDCQMDRIARELGWDPLEFRLKNALREGDVSSTGQVLDAVAAVDTLEQAARAVGWAAGARPPRPPAGTGAPATVVSGRGISTAMMNTGATRGKAGSMAVVTANSDGTVVLSIGSVDVGQGSRTVLAQIAAETLGIPYETVVVNNGDTEVTPVCAGSGASQTTFVTGSAVARAALDLKEMLLRVAGERLQAAPADLEVHDGVIHPRQGAGQSISVAEVAAICYASGQFPIGRGAYRLRPNTLDPETGQGTPYPAFSYASTVADVDVDPGTGQVRVRRLVMAVDVGKAVNPLLIECQIQGGAMMNLGYVLTEDLFPGYPSADGITTGFHDYLIPTAPDTPEIVSLILEKPSGGPYGIKGIGEIVATVATAAIVNAVYDATGVLVKTLPLTPENVLRHIRGETAAAPA